MVNKTRKLGAQPADEETYRIQLTLNAKDRLATTSETFGMRQIALTARLVEWFAAQDETLQGAVLGLYPTEVKKEIGKILLARLDR